MSWASKVIQPEDRVAVDVGELFLHVQFGPDMMLSGEPGVLVEKLSEALTHSQAQLDGKAGDAD